MKKYFLSIGKKLFSVRKILTCLVVVVLFSCSQPNVTQNTTGDPEISFDANNARHVYSGQAKNPNYEIGVFAWKDHITTPPERNKYEFWGYKDLSNRIAILAYPDSLKVQKYNSIRINGSIVNTAGITLEVNDESYTTKGAVNDYFELIITEYKNGVVSGTFSANASSDANPAFNIPPIIITNGVLKNVKLAYW